MTELVHHQAGALTEQMDYARAVASGNLLPQAYRGKPADIMIAVGLGQAMGLSPAESLYRIDVIQGKPTASGELIASNVRKAGHKLRVKVDEQAMSVTATIVRSDDPDFPHEVTRDMKWAQTMGLHTKDNYKKQPLTMLQWRAVSAVARLACPEALYGVAYTSDEIRESEPAAPTKPTGMDGLRAAVQTPAEDVHDAEIVAEAVEEERADTQPVEPMTARTRGQMFALFSELNISEDDQRKGISHIVGRPIESRGEIGESEARVVIERLKVKKAERDAGAAPVEPGLFEGGAA